MVLTINHVLDSYENRIGPALSETINQAAPTLCMKAPMSEKTLAISKSRNVFPRNGRHALAGALTRRSPTNCCDFAGSILFVLFCSVRLNRI